MTNNVRVLWIAVGGLCAMCLAAFAELAGSGPDGAASVPPDRGNVTVSSFAEPIVSVSGRTTVSTVDRLVPLSVTGASASVDDPRQRRYIISSIVCSLRRSVLNRLMAGGDPVFELPLSNTESVSARIDTLRRRSAETVTLSGRLEGKDGDFILVCHRGIVSGAVSLYAQNRHYELVSIDPDNVVVRWMNSDAFNAPCGAEEDPVGGPSVAVSSDACVDDALRGVAGGAVSAFDMPQATDDADTVMDIVVGYSRQARLSQGGQAQIEARIIGSVDRMNMAFANSNITNIQLVLVATIEDPLYVEPGTTDGSLKDELDALYYQSDGKLDAVSQLRVERGADLNSFVVAYVDGDAGRGHIPGQATVVAATYMSPTRTVLAHELGHNIGCCHAWGDTTSVRDVSTSGNQFGWRFLVGATKYRSVMSYDWGWTRVPYFSNPSVVYPESISRTGATDGYDATGDATTDSRFVSGGYCGTAGAGFDGSHPLLGANNAAYIQANARFVADNATRIAVLEVIPTSLPSGQVGGTYAYGLRGTNGALPYTWSISEGALQDGLSLSADGLISGVPTVGGTNQITFTVQDDDGDTADRMLVLEIAPAELDHLMWSAIAATQTVDVSMAVTVSAMDRHTNVFTAFTNAVAVSGWQGERSTLTIGNGETGWDCPLNTFYEDIRTQVIYLSAEMGGPCTIQALSLYVSDIPGCDLADFVIRMKHTSLDDYGFGAAWEYAGWTQVYSGYVSQGATGWRTFSFTTPFVYDGTNNLMIDFSNDGTEWGWGGECWSTSMSPAYRSIYYRSDSDDGDPLGWPTNGYSPFYSVSEQIPDLRLELLDGRQILVTPAMTTPFVNGQWSGWVTVNESAADMYLAADDPWERARTGQSARFDVIATDTDEDGIPDHWEARFFGGPTNALADGDSDRDGLSNFAEFVADTDPTNDQSCLAIEAFAVEPGRLITFPTSLRRTYRLQYATNLSADVWQDLRSDIPGSGGAKQISDSQAVPQRHYRIRVDMP